MYVFIDDSGDPGFKFDKGSSRYFVIACCVFETAEAAESASTAISDLKDRLGRPQHVEFKFAKTRLDTQVQFFDALSREDFFVRLVAADKAGMIALPDSVESLEVRAVASALQALPANVSQLSVFVDGRGGKKSKNYLKNLPRASSRRFPHPKVRFVSSHRNTLIQLADMVAGCARRSLNPLEARSQDYLSMLEPLLSRTDSSWERWG
jgi:hypothetical protein